MLELNPISGLANAGRAAGRDAKDGAIRGRTLDSPGADALEISPGARKAAEIQRLAEAARNQDELRREQVEQAKERLREGAYRVQDVVLQVAARIEKLIG